ncbi:MAG: PHP domain-containing protein [Methanomassiliicoccales archaeon]
MASRVAFLFHVHTNRSVDSFMPMKYVMKYCKKKNIRLIAMCEHNYLMPSSERKALEKEYGVRIMPAIEYATNYGDIIAMGTEEFSKTRECTELIEFIKHQGGLIILPHPYRGHALNKIPMEKIDLIETFNGRCSNKENMAAINLASHLEKIGIAGCDAHFPWELGLAMNEIDVNFAEDDDIELLVESMGIVHNKRGCPKVNSFLSQVVKTIKLP